ncbi:MAG: ABC transporter permease [Ginsengibacter sp.]
MIKNYFKTAWRNLRFNKVFTAINVIGLALGMSTFIILSAYIHFEKSYDRMPKDADNIYHDYYNRQYRQEIQFGKMFLLFSSLAILIACLGLLGLTIHSTARRKKEIGIRKVLGGSVPSIIGMLGSGAVKLILMSSIVALPLSAFFITQWLQGYAYRVQLTWWQFVLPVICLILIAIISIGYMTFKAAMANPVESLRSE